MKNIFTGLVLLLSAINLYAQPSILLVDDSKDNFDNTGFLALALDSAGYAYTVFHADTEQTTPGADLMSQYDLVIWHTSTDGVGLFLWGNDGEENGDLQLYLEDGGNLWVIGNDFLFDRYGAAADTFQTGDFPYEYFGIERYVAQAYGDDGGIGVSSVAPATGQPADGLGELGWQFATLWWADAVAPRAEATPVYLMQGGAGYPLQDMPAAVWYDNGTFRTMSFYFDLALVSDFALAKETMASVVGLFSNFVSSSAETQLVQSALGIAPNPFAQSVKLSLSLEQPSVASIKVLDLMGRELAQPLKARQLAAGDYDFQWTPAQALANGVYLARIEINGKTAAKYIVLSR